MERAEMIRAFEGVDYVYIFDEKDCIRFVELAKPDIHVNDASYGEDCIESEAVREAGGRLHLLHKVDVPSTSEIIGRIVQLP
jgi:bifunctional ADP-heptose synthase (sugar kinase/adenylyltransferase)